MTKLKQYSSKGLPYFVRPSLYRALKFVFPWNIGGLSLDDTIKSEMGTDSIGQGLGVLTSVMFNPGSQH